MTDTTGAAHRAGADRFRLATAAFSEIAMPVAVIGAAHGPNRSCATGTLMYVSLVPPQVAIALHHASRTFALIREAGEFSASLLSSSQVEVARAAGRPGLGPDKFAAAGIPVLDAPSGFTAPAVDGSVAVIWCRVERQIETGDHVLIVGSVGHHVTLDAAGPQLLRVSRRYATLGPELGDEERDLPL